MKYYSQLIKNLYKFIFINLEINISFIERERETNCVVSLLFILVKYITAIKDLRRILIDKLSFSD